MTAFITRYLRNASRILGLWCATALCAFADPSLQSSRAEGELAGDGQLAVSTRFQVKLPAALTDALEQGVTLSFRLDVELTRPRMLAYRLSLSQWFEPHASLSFKLSYQALTNRYRVTIGSLSRYYPTLSEALSAIGSISGWRVLDPGTLSNLSPHDVEARARLALDIGELPKPFQLNAFGSPDWELASGWVRLGMKGG
jgi:hypothetical protein